MNIEGAEYIEVGSSCVRRKINKEKPFELDMPIKRKITKLLCGGGATSGPPGGRATCVSVTCVSVSVSDQLPVVLASF